jgi:hypothetical protein
MYAITHLFTSIQASAGELGTGQVRHRRMSRLASWLGAGTATAE